MLGGTSTGPAASIQAEALEYDGTNWTAAGNMVTPRRFNGSAGTQTEGITFGGGTAPGAVVNTENYDGSSFSTGVSLGSAIFKHGSAVGGTQTSALSFGGNPSVTATEEFTEAKTVKTITDS